MTTVIPNEPHITFRGSYQREKKKRCLRDILAEGSFFSVVGKEEKIAVGTRKMAQVLTVLFQDSGSIPKTPVVA